MICSKCGGVIPDGQNVCPNCGNQISIDNNVNKQHQVTYQNVYVQKQAPENLPGKGEAVASMVLGIVGLVFLLTTLWYVSLIIGIIGLILAIVSKSKGFSGGINTAGLVMNIITLILSGIVFLACTACVAALGTADYSFVFTPFI